MAKHRATRADFHARCESVLADRLRRRLLELADAIHRGYRLCVFRDDLFCRPDASGLVADRTTLVGGSHPHGGSGLEAQAARMKGVNVDIVANTMRIILQRRGDALIYRDPANGQTLHVDASAASEADGLLPAILVAGESVWRDLTGKGFELDLVRDPAALLGFRLQGIGGASFSIVMLASIEALDQVKRAEGIIINEFNALWTTAARHHGAVCDL